MSDDELNVLAQQLRQLGLSTDFPVSIITNEFLRDNKGSHPNLIKSMVRSSQSDVAGAYCDLLPGGRPIPC
jgi:hypothetical protein